MPEPGPKTSGIPMSKESLPPGTVYREPEERNYRVIAGGSGETPVGYTIEDRGSKSRGRRRLRLKRGFRVNVRAGSTPSVPNPEEGRIIAKKRKLSKETVLRGMRNAASRDKDPELAHRLIDELDRRWDE